MLFSCVVQIKRHLTYSRVLFVESKYHDNSVHSGMIIQNEKSLVFNKLGIIIVGNLYPCRKQLSIVPYSGAVQNVVYYRDAARATESIRALNLFVDNALTSSKFLSKKIGNNNESSKYYTKYIHPSKVTEFK